MKETSATSREPLITIITSTYNAEQFLEQTIESVLQQTYTNTEYIIIDGGSQDKTVDIISKYKHRLSYWVSEKDTGVYNAWNKALAKAKGDWIVFLGADDYLYNEQVLTEAVADLNAAADKHIRFVYGKVNLLSPTGKNSITVWGEHWEKSKRNILRFMSVTHCGAFHHQSLFEEYGNFNEQFRITGDYEFLLREFSKGRDAYFINRVITVMRAGGMSANLKSKLTIAKENIKALELNRLPVTTHHKMQIVKAKLANFIARFVGPKTLHRLSDFYRTLKGKDKLWS